jgi:ArsR family transcriptional regulator
MVVDVCQVARRIDACQYEGMRTIQTITGCCAPIAGEPLSMEQAEQVAASFKLLGDPTRVRLLSLLAAADGPVCVCDLPEALGVKQPTVSHHLKALHEAGLVTRDQRGKWAFYALDRSALTSLAGMLAT